MDVSKPARFDPLWVLLESILLGDRLVIQLLLVSCGFVKGVLCKATSNF